MKYIFFDVINNSSVVLPHSITVFYYFFKMTVYLFWYFINNVLLNPSNGVAGSLAVGCLVVSFVFCSAMSMVPRISKIVCLPVLCVFMLFSWILSCIQCYYSCFDSIHLPIHIPLGTWMVFSYFKIQWSFLFDPICCIMMFMVTLISFLIHLYSIEYMKDDPRLPLFMSYLTLFTFFMLILLSSGNLVQLFLGWEGIGLSSYLLIGFWFSRPRASQSALKAILVNRIGDFFLILAIGLCYSFYSTVDFLLLKVIIATKLSDYTTLPIESQVLINELIAIFIALAALVKSAQFGFHTWLADAMEGPTPVSAFIHAATLVTAGVFLVIRCSFIIEQSVIAPPIICLFGGLTTLFGSTIGVYQNDIKKIVAYSTCSQLGYMFFACGCSNYILALFHLFNHAFFKALLFLCAGSVIHAVVNEQDIRKMGGLYNRMPLTFVCMLIASLSLVGFPFFSGFYSKDLIMESSYFFNTTFGSIGYWFSLSSIFMTSFYSARLLYFVFFPRGTFESVAVKNATDPGFFMSFPLVVLAFFSIFGGYFFSEMLIGLGTDFWQSSIIVKPTDLYAPTIPTEFPQNPTITKPFKGDTRVISEFSMFFIKLAPTLVSISGLAFSFVVHHYYPFYLFFLFNKLFFFPIFKFLNKAWFFDYAYNYFFVKKFILSCYNLILVKFDRGFLELFFGPRILISFSKNFFNFLRNEFHSGLIYEHLLYFVLGAVFVSVICFDSNLLILGFFILSPFIFIFFLIKICVSYYLYWKRKSKK